MTRSICPRCDRHPCTCQCPICRARLPQATTRRFTYCSRQCRDKAQRARSAARSIPPLTPVASGGFATIVADPPWRYENTTTRGAAENHYPTMSTDELCTLDVVREAAAPAAHLYLWATSSHLPEAFKVMSAWGFEYRTYLVWVKPQLGMGNYFRVSTELVLFGIRGGLRTRARDIPNYFNQGRGRHSAKPSRFYDLVEKSSPGPYLELFARCVATEALFCACSRCSRGWTTWGDQAGLEAAS